MGSSYCIEFLSLACDLPHSLTHTLFAFLCFFSLLFFISANFLWRHCPVLRRTKAPLLYGCMHSLDCICYVNKFNRMFSQTMMLFIYQLASCKCNQPVYFWCGGGGENCLFRTSGNVLFKWVSSFQQSTMVVTIVRKRNIEWKMTSFYRTSAQAHTHTHNNNINTLETNRKQFKINILNCKLNCMCVYVCIHIHI